MFINVNNQDKRETDNIVNACEDDIINIRKMRRNDKITNDAQSLYSRKAKKNNGK
jgi:hypothetical protein